MVLPELLEARFGNRFVLPRKIIGGGHASLLATAMPQGNPDRVGQLCLTQLREAAAVRRFKNLEILSATATGDFSVAEPASPVSPKPPPTHHDAGLAASSGQLAERQADRPERLLRGAAPRRRHGQTGVVCLRRQQPHRSPDAAERPARRAHHLAGRYACASIGGVPGKRLLIERSVGGSRWCVVGALTTGTGGAYAAHVTLGRTGSCSPVSRRAACAWYRVS